MNSLYLFEDPSIAGRNLLSWKGTKGVVPGCIFPKLTIPRTYWNVFETFQKKYKHSKTIQKQKKSGFWELFKNRGASSIYPGRLYHIFWNWRGGRFCLHFSSRFENWKINWIWIEIDLKKQKTIDFIKSLYLFVELASAGEICPHVTVPKV